MHLEQSCNASKHERISVNVKSVCDHFNLDMAKYEKKLHDEEIVTGGGNVETSELDVLLEEIKRDSESCQSLISSEKDAEKGRGRSSEGRRHS